MSTQATAISCIILAGGRGARFDNRDKGLVELDGQALVAHVIHVLQPQVDDIVISANRNLENYRQHVSTVIHDKTDDYRGPLSGIIAALPHCRHQWILVVPCDMPFLPDDLVRQLTPGTGDEQIIIAASQNRLQLVFLMHRSLLTNLQTFIAKGNASVMQWIESHNVVVVEFPDNAHAFANINSMHDLSQLK